MLLRWLAILLPLLLLLLPLLSPYLRRYLGDASDPPDNNRGDGAHHSNHRRQVNDDATPMDRHRALEILGLEDNATSDDIRQAHRRLMQKLHPDVGGSSFLATQINRARSVLLGQ